MPLVTLTLRQRRPAVFKQAVLDAIHAALVQAGIPEADRFQRVFTLEAADAHMDPWYPDLPRPRTDDALLIEILWSVGRSVRIKRALLADLMQRLDALHGIRPVKEFQTLVPEADDHAAMYRVSIRDTSRQTTRNPKPCIRRRVAKSGVAEVKTAISSPGATVSSGGTRRRAWRAMAGKTALRRWA